MSNWSKKNLKEKGLMQGDLTLWMMFLALCFISIIMVYSASSNMTYNSGKYWMPVVRHSIFVAAGVVVTWFVHMMPCKLFKLISLVTTLVAYILLGVALVAGGEVNGATRWIGIGSITIQPSEIAKVGLVMTTAFLFSVFRDKKGVTSFGTKIAAGNIVATLALIVTENLSTAGIIFIVMFLMAFFAQVPRKWLLWIICPLAAGGIGGYLTLTNLPESTLDYCRNTSGVLHRVPTWVNRLTKAHEIPADPMEYDLTQNIQVTHSHIAVAGGGLLGRGPGNSIERDFLPQAFSDFIYAIILEEGGLWLGAIVMGIYLIILYRSMRIAQRCKSLFPAYLIMGLALMLVIQAMVNMAVAVGAFPVTGQPLPLISRGGTSTFVNCAYLGMMLSVSRSARQIDESELDKENGQEAGEAEKAETEEIEETNLETTEA